MQLICLEFVILLEVSSDDTSQRRLVEQSNGISKAEKERKTGRH